MKAVILAGGMGTRLGTLIPKPLTSLVDETCILDYQVQKLAKKVGLHNILVVVGYKKELIMEKHPELLYVYNDAYAKTSTAKGLLCAFKKINEDVIWLNGDVFFEEGVLDLIANSNESAILVNNARVGEEEIKYSLTSNNYVKEISKSVANAKGEAVGINLLKAADIPLFVNELEKVENTDYFEKALENLTLTKRLALRPILLGELFCAEIDFEEDLQKVRNYLTMHRP